METEALLLVAEYSRNVAVLQWPEQADERDTLARLGLPRLLLVDATTAPPLPEPSCLEDWTRVPVEPEDLRVRLATLAARSAVHRAAPNLDPLGQLYHRDVCVTLSPTEERLVAVLLGHFGRVVSDDQLLEAGWSDGEASHGALRIHLTRLRRRIRPLGLVIKSRRGVGHVMTDAVMDVAALAT